MTYQFITSEQGDDGIVVVTINDPDAKNAVNWVMNKELVVEFDRIEADPKARVLIVTGSGRIFCSGGNIKRMTSEGKSLEPPDPTLREEMFPQEADIRAVVTGLRRLSKPVIAAVNGAGGRFRPWHRRRLRCAHRVSHVAVRLGVRAPRHRARRCEPCVDAADHRL